MKRCLKCGAWVPNLLKPGEKEHDCTDARRRRIGGVNSLVEQARQRNLKALKEVGDRGGPPPPDTGESVPVP